MRFFRIYRGMTPDLGAFFAAVYCGAPHADFARGLIIIRALVCLLGPFALRIAIIMITFLR